MKKSNILLLTGFLAVVLLISAIHISLYAKYKAGDFTVFNAEEELASLAMQSFPNILFVSVRNVPNARVKFSDVAKVEKDVMDEFQYTRRGDTLLISAKENAYPEGHHPVEFHLPHSATLAAYNSRLSFESGKTPDESDPVIYLTKSEAYFFGADNRFRLGQVKIVASDGSTVTFGKTLVNKLDVRLSHSAIESGEGSFGQLSIETDSLSRISLQSKHLLKANIKITAL